MIHASGMTGVRARGEASTSPGVWAVVIAAATALLCLRMPAFLAVAEAAVAEQAEALGDPQLAGTATAVGAGAAVVIHLLLLGLGALLAALLERALGPRALCARRGRPRLGVGGAAFAAIVLGLQVAALVEGVAAVERSWPVWLGAAAVAAIVPAAFPEGRSSLGSYARSLAASGATAVLLCLG
ncbi:hypothetical protein [Agrococcus jenensis]|uniref:Uncharacterized protein n=1 Tax=Agrococcus jenensis TaxID=46353 RepID=A0A3N2ASP1_9MICO|nr:hypothetical protein [Agrococcus jenensis]ROR66044.1 hypothetical protein EDD26_1419 [Agrococcus jenensis]